jgi:Leucine-rich repeat (LRR) protein
MMEKEERIRNYGSIGMTRQPTSLKGLLFLLILGLHASSTSSFCPQYCHCDDIALSVNCQSGSNLRVVPIFLNPQIKYLSLAQNQIKDITLSFQFYAELQFLDLSLNQLDSLGKTNFDAQKNLKVLNVSFNSLKVLETEVFTGLTGVEVLDLTGNQIDRVEREIFWKLGQIKEIILDRNRLEFLDWDLFRGLDTLVRLSVQFNFIGVIEPSPSFGQISASAATTGFNSPWTLKNLQILDVSSNQLTRVKDYSLIAFTSLRDLNLCCNYIHTLEDRAFSSGLHLERVNLSQNRLGRVPTDSLVNMGGSLRQLDLSSNRISDQIPKSAFRSLFKLESLRLTDNPAVLSLHPDALSDQINLINFEADYLSNLTELSSNLLENKPSLEHFSIKYASISTLPAELFPSERDGSGGGSFTGSSRHSSSQAAGSRVRALDLTGNPIDCNCSVYPLFQYLEQEADAAGEEGDPVVIPSPLETTHSFNSNLSLAHYTDPNHQYRSRNSNNNRSYNNAKHSSSYLSTLRCHSPMTLSGILVKDLKNSDFVDCFAREDNFTLIVICIAGAISSLILLILGIKLCHSCGGWKKVSAFCKNHQCCHRRKDAGGGSDSGDLKADRLFESMMGLRRGTDLPPTNPATFHLNHPGSHYGPATGTMKLVLAPNATQHNNSHSPNHNFYVRDGDASIILGTTGNINGSSSNTLGGRGGGAPPIGYTMMEYNNGYVPEQLEHQFPHHHHPHRHATLGKYNVHHQPSHHYPPYPPPLPPTNGPGNNPSVMVHYEYPYHHHPQASAEYASPSKSSSHRVKQVPSVLV